MRLRTLAAAAALAGALSIGAGTTAAHAQPEPGPGFSPNFALINGGVLNAPDPDAVVDSSNISLEQILQEL